jgi:hypothetical protein
VKTVAQALNEFLAEQKERLSERTYQRYEGVVSLFKSYLESYWPGHEEDSRERMRKEQTFRDSFEAKDMEEGFQGFLAYFMPRKVCGGEETMQSAGTTIKKLSKWLAEKGLRSMPVDPDNRIEETARGLNPSLPLGP